MPALKKNCTDKQRKWALSIRRHCFKDLRNSWERLGILSENGEICTPEDREYFALTVCKVSECVAYIRIKTDPKWFIGNRDKLSFANLVEEIETNMGEIK